MTRATIRQLKVRGSPLPKSPIIPPWHPWGRGRDQRTFGCDRGDEDSDCGPDERGGVSDGAKALALDERGDLFWEGPEVRLHVVLEDEAGERARCLILGRHLGEHVDEIRIEVRVTVELLQLLLHGALCA